MSQKCWQAVLKKLDYDSLSVQMIFQCAPLFAGLKISNLLKVREENLISAIRTIRQLGFYCRVLLTRDGKVTLLVFDREKLLQYICRSDVRKLFAEFGYENRAAGTMLQQFTHRYRAFGKGLMEYPHETGLFLGYPPQDVIGFIRNAGKNYLFSGYWKVYHDCERQIELFRQFGTARQEMLYQLACGRELSEIVSERCQPSFHLQLISASLPSQVQNM